MRPKFSWTSLTGTCIYSVRAWRSPFSALYLSREFRDAGPSVVGFKNEIRYDGRDLKLQSGFGAAYVTYQEQLSLHLSAISRVSGVDRSCATPTY